MIELGLQGARATAPRQLATGTPCARNSGLAART